MSKHEGVRRIDLRQPGTATGSAFGLSATGFDDGHLLRRDGARSLYGAARWAWEQGAEVAGVLRSWGAGLLQVFGALYAGQRAGAHAGLFNYQTDAGTPAAVLEVADAGNRPIFSAWAADGANPNEAAVVIGREGGPQIRFRPAAGYDFDVPQVDAGCLPASGAGVTDHGDLTGLGDDDHPQYATEERGDLRWAQLEHSHAARLAVTVVTADYTATGAEDLIVADTATMLTVTLPNATGSGKQLTVKAVGAGTVTVAAAGADLMDGNADGNLNQWGSVRLCDYAEGAWCVL